jgi:hypothetical protein
MPENGPHYAGLDPFSWWIESAEGDTAAAN